MAAVGTVISAKIDFDDESGGSRQRAAKGLHLPVAVAEAAVLVDGEVARAISNLKQFPFVVLKTEILHSAAAALQTHREARLVQWSSGVSNLRSTLRNYTVERTGFESRCGISYLQ